MSEEILGTIEIDHEVLYFTLNRAIVAKTGGKGAAIAFGAIGATLAIRAEKKKREELKKLSLESVLNADKHNFAIPYSGIVRVEMKKRFFASINIIADQKFGKDMKKKKDETIQKDVYTYEKKMEKKKEFEDYVNLVRSVLPDRVVVL